MKKICKVIGFVFIALLCLEMLLTTVPAHATGPTTLQMINPVDGTHEFNFTTAQKSVGDTFSITINVTDVIDLFGWQVAIAWDPTLLQYSSMVIPANNVFTGQSPLIAGPDTSVPGLVVFGAILPPGGRSFNGTGTITQLNLTIIQGVSSSGVRQVHCNIPFINLGADTFLLDSKQGVIEFTPFDAHYTYTAPPPPPARLFINPLKVVDPTLTAGAQFNVSLNIGDATNVNLWSTDILYDNTILSAISAEEGDFLRSLNSTNFSFTIQQNYNATNGLIQINCTLSSEGASGNGTLATITFQVLNLGQSGINMTNVLLLDPSSLPLPFSTRDGYFNNILMAKLSIDPPEVTGSQYSPGTTFTINVTLEGVQDFKVAVFNLTYLPSVIQEIDINVPSILGQIPIKKLQVDDGAGYIWCNITFHNGITTITPVTLMMVQFQVLAMGVSPINLTDTQLYDMGDNPITHEVHHGIFIGLIRHVAVTNVDTDLHMAYQGWNVSVNMTVKNKGNITETFGVHFYYDGNLGGTATVVNLVPDEERVMIMTWSTSAVQPCHNYTISGVADPAPYQTDLSDINFTDGNVKIRLMGDVNGDGKVDMRDIAQLVQVFHTFPGKPNWTPENDLDNNGLIDMRDIAICIMNFGKSCS